MNNEEFIEYEGISSLSNKSKNSFFIEFNYAYDLEHDIDEIIKISASTNTEYSTILGEKVTFCILKLHTSIEFIKTAEEFSLSLKNFTTYSSFHFVLDTKHNQKNFKVYINNITGKLLYKSKILIFYNLLVNFS
ncbi:MAG: hypothetical protein ACRDAU_07170 [Clostridium sp.]